MATENETSPSVTEAAMDWLRGRTNVSASTAAAYRGEVNRLGEYLAAAGVRVLADVSERLWSEYLETLMTGRTGVASRRKGVLLRSSALQAARITRAFLRHCWLQGWLSWSPGFDDRPCKVEENDSVPLGSPARWRRALLGPAGDEDERTARQRCAVSLAFWGGLKPRELASLRDPDLVIRPDETGELWVSGRRHPVECPRELILALKRYRVARAAGQAQAHAGGLQRRRDAPLLSRLRSTEPISAHSAWQLLRDWPSAADSGAAQRLGSKALRDGYLMLARVDADLALDQIARQTGRKPALAGTVDPATEVCVDRVRQRLLDGQLDQP